ncbi:hypothetical protein HCU64_06455 [Methylobacterium sp. C25]|uniref:hypothetical protein n=1 Tax=Methylobacterium sp. C25 TaxID=2721622 RepID=UPI001F3A6F6E|nr:hypothetical protein [Methylobacterium sp. C25]MCE4223387.1 hypothetical protein [Methylobacterium sp. C25]
MINARFADPGHTAIIVDLAEGDQLGNSAGPAQISFAAPSEGLPAYDALMEMVEAGSAAIAEFEAPAQPVPDNPTLSDWRVGLTLWGRIDDVTAKVNALVASSVPAQAMLGKVAKERLEYANNVLCAQLLQLKDAFGFTAADVDESLWRAAQVAKGDLSGQWPLPGAV